MEEIVGNNSPRVLKPAAAGLGTTHSADRKGRDVAVEIDPHGSCITARTMLVVITLSPFLVKKFPITISENCARTTFPTSLLGRAEMIWVVCWKNSANFRPKSTPSLRAIWCGFTIESRKQFPYDG